MERLIKALATLETDEDRRHFLVVLLTPAELKKFDRRCHAMQLLLEGTTQRAARDEASLSIATVNHAAKWLRKEEQFIRSVFEPSLRRHQEG